jgi:hypothetical protein
MTQWLNPVYRLACPAGAFFLTFGLWEPRGSVLLALGGRFLRAARFSFLRSCLSLIFVVSISEASFSFSTPRRSFILDADALKKLLKKLFPLLFSLCLPADFPVHVTPALGARVLQSPSPRP